MATYNSSEMGFRELYWDGSEVATQTGSIDTAGKSQAFNIGYSTVFGGRDFDESSDEVGVWNYALSSAQVANI